MPFQRKLLTLTIALSMMASCRNEFEAGSFSSRDEAMDSGAEAGTGGKTTVRVDAGGIDVQIPSGMGGTSGTGGAITLDAALPDTPIMLDSATIEAAPLGTADSAPLGGLGGTFDAPGSGGAPGTGGVTTFVGTGGSSDARDGAQDTRDVAPDHTDSGDAVSTESSDAPPGPGTGGVVQPPPLLGGTPASGGMNGQGGAPGTGGVATGGSPGTNAPERYLILMDDQFLGNPRLQELVAWKQEKGYDVRTVTTSTIASSGSPTHAQIVEYMQSLPAADYPRYLLIIGDADASNGVAAYKFQTSGVPIEHSDLFAYPQQYTDRFILNRGQGVGPTVFGGRLPASNTAELTIMLDKVLRMDRSPPDASSGMYDRVVVSGELMATLEDGKYVDRGNFAEMQDAAISYFTQAGNGTRYQVATALVQEGTLPQGAEVYWSPTQTQLWRGAQDSAQLLGTRVLQRYLTGPGAADTGLTSILDSTNAGAVLLLFIGRADTNGWWRPPFTSAATATGLHNGNNLPLVISDASNAGVYYSPTGNPTLSPGEPFAKSLLVHPNGGAYAVIGATDLLGTTGITHGLLMAFLGDYRSWLRDSATPGFTSALDAPDPSKTGMVEGEATRLGQMLAFAQRYLGTDSSYHLLGDPEMSLMLHPPQAQAVSYPAKILPGAARQLTIFTGEDGSLVCLYDPAQGIHMAGTTLGGTITLALPAASEGTLQLTVTHAGRTPYRGTVSITSTIPRGDVDGSGTIDAHDAEMIANYYAGLPVYDLIPEAADANCDGVITVVDALVVGQIASGMNPITDCEQSNAATP